MKLRALVLGLLIANLLMGAWQLGWLDALVGVEARTEREPARVLQQLRPQSMTVSPLGPDNAGTANPATTSAARTSTNTRPSPATEAVMSPVAPALVGVAGGVVGGATVAVAAPSGPRPAASTVASGESATGGAVCLEAGPFNAQQIVVAETRINNTLSSERWRRITTERPPSVGVVMGPFPTPAALRAKAVELERMGVKFDRIVLPQADGTPTPKGPTLYVLTRSASRAAAEASLASLGKRGVRTARVLALQPGLSTHRIRAEGLTEAQAQSLRTSGSGVENRVFAACNG